MEQAAGIEAIAEQEVLDIFIDGIKQRRTEWEEFYQWSYGMRDFKPGEEHECPYARERQLQREAAFEMMDSSERRDAEYNSMMLRMDRIALEEQMQSKEGWNRMNQEEYIIMFSRD